MILSGSVTDPLLLSSPLLILSTKSIPSITLPKTVYCLSKKGDESNNGSVTDPDKILSFKSL